MAWDIISLGRVLDEAWARNSYRIINCCLRFWIGLYFIVYFYSIHNIILFFKWLNVFLMKAFMTLYHFFFIFFIFYFIKISLLFASFFNFFCYSSWSYCYNNTCLMTNFCLISYLMAYICVIKYFKNKNPRKRLKSM